MTETAYKYGYEQGAQAMLTRNVDKLKRVLVFYEMLTSPEDVVIAKTIKSCINSIMSVE